MSITNNTYVVHPFGSTKSAKLPDDRLLEYGLIFAAGKVGDEEKTES